MGNYNIWFKLGSLGVCTLPREGPATQHLSCTTGHSPGSFRSLAEFHPIIPLYITHKITSIIANFMGISKLIQSILPSLSTCNSRSFQNTWASSFCQQEINGGFPPQLRVAETPGRALRANCRNHKIPENWYSSGEFGSLTLDNAAGIARCARYPQVIHILLWITLMEFGSFS